MIRLKTYFIKNDIQPEWIEIVDKRICDKVVDLLELDDRKLVIEEYKEFYNRFSLKQKLKVHFPNLLKIYRRIRQ